MNVYKKIDLLDKEVRKKWPKFRWSITIVNKGVATTTAENLKVETDGVRWRVVLYKDSRRKEPAIARVIKNSLADIDHDVLESIRSLHEVNDVMKEFVIPDSDDTEKFLKILENQRLLLQTEESDLVQED
jgi:hypothetical protein